MGTLKELLGSVSKEDLVGLHLTPFYIEGKEVHDAASFLVVVSALDDTFDPLQRLGLRVLKHLLDERT